MNLVTFISLLLFGFLFVATLVAYVRRRDPLGRDVMLIFASVAAMFGTIGIGALGQRLPDPVYGAAIALLLAQPLFALRLAHQIHAVPRAVRIVALVAFVISAVPMLVLPLRSIGLLLVPAGVVFAASHLVAAYYLAREAARRVGAARVRLGSAAAAGTAMALSIGLVIFGSQAPVAPEVGRILALGSATLYVLAFMPPAWVRKVWSAVAIHEFMQALIGTDAEDSVTSIWTRATELGRRTSGSVAAIVVTGQPPRVLARDFEPGTETEVRELDVVPGAANESRPLTKADGALGAAADGLGAPYVSIIPFAGVHDEPGALILFRSRPSLFAADDARIIGPLVDGAAVFAQRSEALEQQGALTDRLAVTVQALEHASQAKSDFLEHEPRAAHPAERDHRLHGSHDR